MQEAAGFLQGVLVHAFTPAFHRIPVMYARLGAGFSASEEVREVLDAMIRILAMRREKSILTGPREAAVLEKLEGLRQALDATPPPAR
jgi:hypothetical protein